MKPFTSLCFAVLLGSTVLLSACGGGSGSTTAAPAPAPAPGPTSTPSIQSYSVGGTITGLGDDGGMALRNGADFMWISPRSTSFTFPTLVTQGGAYSVTLGSPLASGRSCEILNGAGTMGSAAVQTVVVRCETTLSPATPAPAPVPTPPAPLPAFPGSTLATGFTKLVGIAADGAGNVVAADGFTISRTAATGATTQVIDQYGLPLRTFAELKHVITDKAGNFYVVDGAAIWKISSTGVLTFLVQLPDPVGGIAVDGAGTLYLTTNNTVQKLVPGGALTMVAKLDVPAAHARVDDPRRLAVDAAGNIYVADYSNFAVRKISPQGQVTRLQLGSAVVDQCVGAFGCLVSYLLDIALDTNGQIYIAVRNVDLSYRGGGARRFVASKLLKVATDGSVSVLELGVAAGYEFGGMAVDGAGTVYLADSTHNSILKLKP